MSAGAGSGRGLKWAGAIGVLCVLVGALWLTAWQSAQPGGSPWAGPLARYGIRAAVIVLALVLWFWTQSLIAAAAVQDGRIGDLLHGLSEPWNDFLQARPRLSNAILIVSSGFIDLFALFLIGAGVFGRTLRPFIGLLMVFVFRQLCQATCSLPVPPKMIWRNPGFPSLLVTYGVANDFFISGHTAIAVLGAIEVYRIMPGWCAAAAGAVALLEAGTVIVLRAHYTMDVLGAVAAAVCAAGLAGQLCAGLGL